MSSLPSFSKSTSVVAGLTLEVHTRGVGPTLVFLHSGEGLFGAHDALERLSRDYRVVVPSHPGFGNSELPAWVSSVDDISYIYLDFLKTLGGEPSILVGSSFGGWLAAEIAVKSTSSISSLVLVDALGVKINGPSARDIVDMHATPEGQLPALLYADVTKRIDPSTFSDEDGLIYFRNRETLALLGWRPYMYNPRLRGRLHRIDVPTLVVWGDRDGIVSTDYGQQLASDIPGSRFALVKDAGHYPYIEKPAEFSAAIDAFCGQTLRLTKAMA